MSDVSELVQELERYAESISIAIESSDWDDLNELLVNRQEVLEQLCALSLSSLDRKAVVNMMNSMQAADRQFLALVQSQKEALRKQAALLAHDRKAIQAYQGE
jgi:hypothetical protein